MGYLRASRSTAATTAEQFATTLEAPARHIDEAMRGVARALEDQADFMRRELVPRFH